MKVRRDSSQGVDKHGAKCNNGSGVLLKSILVRLSASLGLGKVGFEEHCSHQCHRPVGKLGRHCRHQKHSSVGRSQTSSSRTGWGQWICGAIMVRLDTRVAPSTEREPEFHEAGGWMEVASCVAEQCRLYHCIPHHQGP